MRTPLSFLAVLSLLGCPVSSVDTDKVDSGGDTAADCSGDACDADGDGVTVGDGDCDDSDAAAYPGAAETCNEVDDDCNGTIDDGAGTPWYSDQDTDGYGNAITEYVACDQPAGYVADGTDCDDTSAAAFPGNAEVCDEVDNNCDGTVDEGVVGTFYTDADGDTFGDETMPVSACEPSEGVAVDGSDCDDANPAVNPGAPELCNEIDDDCDGGADGNAVDADTYYVDADADGFGDASASTTACNPLEGYAPTSDDCNDADATVNPAASELCNGADDNCNGTADDGAVDAAAWFSDADGDTFGDEASMTVSCSQPAGTVSGPGDCDDTSASVNPMAAETCNAVDDNCNGTVDDNASDALAWFTDADGDNFGAGTPTVSCSAVAGTVSDGSDCDDTNAAVNPTASETCNGADDNCNGTADDGATDAGVWFADADGDTFGDPSVPTTSCSAPAGYVSGAGDCDDADGGAYPGATETCDGVDNNCNSTADDVVTFLSSQAQADALVDCTELDQLSISSTSTVTTIDLPLVESVAGNVFIDGSGTLTSLSMPALLVADAGIQFTRNTALTAIDLSSLEAVGGTLELNSNTALTTADFSSLMGVGGDTRLFGNTAWCVPSLGWASFTTGSTTIASNLCN